MDGQEECEAEKHDDGTLLAELSYQTRLPTPESCSRKGLAAVFVL